VTLNSRLSVSGIKYHIVRQNSTDVSEEHTATIDMVECFTCRLLLAGYLLYLLFSLEDEGSLVLRNVGEFIPDYMVSQSSHRCENLNYRKQIRVNKKLW
jgi:hypothetical protein